MLKLGDAQVDDADARHEAALTIAASLVAISTRILYLDVYDLVYDRFGHDADEILDVDHPVIESRHLVYL